MSRVRRPIGQLAHEPFTTANLRRSVYALACLATGTAWFVLVVTFLSLSVGLMVTLIGIPLLWLTCVIGDGLAAFERAWVSWGVGRPVATPIRRPEVEGFFRRVWNRVIDPVTWRQLAYLILQLPMGILLFTVTLVMWTVPLWCIISPAFAKTNDIPWDWWDDRGHQVIGYAVAVVFGFVVLGAMPWVIRGVVELNGSLARALLGPTAAQQRHRLELRVEAEQTERALAVDSTVSERQRIERDLHDGAQARLVALAMELGRAREQLESGSDPDRAREAVVRAHDQAKQALSEVRDLARGIHPAILTDRGIDAAVSSLVAVSPVPIDTEVTIPHRFSPGIESTAYFVVAEALTNIARHSNASRGSLTIRCQDGVMTIEVRDNGIGGAVATSEARASGGGTGLAGLERRLRTVNGRLVIISPSGGPTTLLATIPTDTAGAADLPMRDNTAAPPPSG